MFFKTKTSRSARNFSAEIDRLREALKRADAVIIGAGAGLSTSAGFTYTGERFLQHFSDFADQYGMTVKEVALQ